MRLVLSFAFLFILLEYSISQVRFVAITDARQVLVGSVFEIEFRLENAEGSGFKEPDWGGIKKVSGPGRSMSTSIINGHMTSSTGYVYSAVAMKEGRYTIGPASIVTNGKTMKTDPVTITVLKNNTKNANSASNRSNVDGDIFIEIKANYNQAYPGQQIILTTKLYTQVGITRMERANKANISHCDIEYNGTEFPVEREVVKGKEYLTKVIDKLIIYPIKEGNITIPSAAYRLILGDDSFGFGGLQSLFSNTAKVVETNSINIKILPLPQPKPDNFSGAVGNFILSFTPLSKQYSVSDAIKATLEIEGNGNFKKINPKIQLEDSLIDIMEPSTSGPQKVSDEKDLIQRQKFEFLLTPKNEGSLDINLGFCYFDPDQKKYIQVNDSNRISILKTVSLTQTNNQELKPIKTTLKKNFLIENQWIFSGLLLLFPLIFGLIISDKKKNSRNWLQMLTHKFLGNRIKQQESSQLINIDEQFLMAIRQKFPELNNSNSLSELKEKIHSFESSTQMAQLNAIITEFQNAKYIPNSNDLMLHSIIQKVDLIQR